MRRLLGALLGLSAALAACDDRGADDETTPTTAMVTTTTAEPDPTTTTSTTEPVPFDIEVRRAAIELLEIRNDVFMHPDVSRVSEYIADTCTCLERERGFIERFVEEGLRWEAGPMRSVAIRVVSDDAREPVLTAVVSQPATHLLGPDDVPVEDVPAGQDLPYRVRLVRNDAGHWRVNILDAVDLDAAAIAEVLNEGLP